MSATSNRYAFWPLLYVYPLLILLMMWDINRSVVVPTDAGPMTALFAAIALLITALVAPIVVEPEIKKFPRWSLIVMGVCFVQMLALTVISVRWDVSMPAWAFVYMPGIMLSLNLAALIILHAWTAGEGFNQPPGIGLIIGGSCSTLILWMGGTTEFGMLQGVSIEILLLCSVMSWLIAIKNRKSGQAKQLHHN